MKKFSLSIAAVAMAFTALAQTASYDVPTTLSYYGTIEAKEGIPFPAANYVTTNPINDGAFIWVPAGSKILYKNTSDEGATAYKWSAPGATVTDEVATDLIVTYDNAGTYDFPTLNATYPSGEVSFAHELKIKVGGVAELCHSDTREWGTTYGLGYAPFAGNNGYLGGSNKLEIMGVGNFYRFSSPDMYVDAVNIYSALQSKNAVSNAHITVMAYLPYLGDNDFSMIGKSGSYGALEVDAIAMSDYKTRNDGAYLPIKDYSVYTMHPHAPMYCEGYPYLFFAVEGFAYENTNEPLTEDFVIVADVLPGRTLDIVDYNNAIAHNSFVRTAQDKDYIRPVSQFGGSRYDPLTSQWASYNFWICPVVRGAETPYSAGIEDVISDSAASQIILERDGDLLMVRGVKDGTVSLYGLNGALRSSAQAANGGVIFNLSNFDEGVYIVTSADGATAKFAK